MNKKAEFKKVNVEQQKRIDKVRYMFSAMYDLMEQQCKTGRETSLAITKLEEAQFWAIKGITRED